MKNASGLARSSEFLKANPEQAPKVHHLRIIPHADGVRVTHHAGAGAASHADHHFDHGDSEGLMSHIAQHTGFEHDGLAPGDPGDEE